MTDASVAKLVLLALAETVGTRLREAKVRAEVIAVGIKSADFSYRSHQMTLKMLRTLHRKSISMPAGSSMSCGTALPSGISGSTRAASGMVWT